LPYTDRAPEAARPGPMRVDRHSLLGRMREEVEMAIDQSSAAAAAAYIEPGGRRLQTFGRPDEVLKPQVEASDSWRLLLWSASSRCWWAASGIMKVMLATGPAEAGDGGGSAVGANTRAVLLQYRRGVMLQLAEEGGAFSGGHRRPPRASWAGSAFSPQELGGPSPVARAFHTSRGSRGAVTGLCAGLYPAAAPREWTPSRPAARVAVTLLRQADELLLHRRRDGSARRGAPRFTAG